MRILLISNNGYLLSIEILLIIKNLGDGMRGIHQAQKKVTEGRAYPNPRPCLHSDTQGIRDWPDAENSHSNGDIVTHPPLYSLTISKSVPKPNCFTSTTCRVPNI